MASGLVPSGVMDASIFAISMIFITTSLRSMLVRLCMVLSSDLEFIYNDGDILCGMSVRSRTDIP